MTDQAGNNQAPAAPAAGGTTTGGVQTLMSPGASTESGVSTNSAPSPQAQAAVADANWRHSLPQDLATSPSLMKYQNMGELAKAYVNLEKTLGTDKVMLPDKHATPEDWKSFFHKAGLPQKFEEYNVNAPKDVQFDDGVLTGFKKAAFESGVFPHQAEKIVSWLASHNLEQQKSAEAKFKSTMETQMGALKKQWGERFNQNMTRIQSMTGKVSEALGQEPVASFLGTTLPDGTPLGNHPMMIKLFEHFAGLMNLDSLEQGEQQGRYNPSELQQKIDSIMANFEHPYHNKNHMNHGAAVKEVEHYFQRLYPEQDDGKGKSWF